MGGCGGGDDKKAIIERGEDFAKYSAAGVQKRFEELTGAELERGASSSETLDTLSLPYSRSSSDSVVRDRYSGFIVLVTGNELALKAVTKKPPRWPQDHRQRVIEGTGSSTGEAGFKRAVRILSSLGKPAGEVKLPPQEIPCQKAGISPEGPSGKEGVCKADQKTITIANADGALKVDGRTSRAWWSRPARCSPRAASGWCAASAPRASSSSPASRWRTRALSRSARCASTW